MASSSSALPAITVKSKKGKAIPQIQGLTGATHDEILGGNITEEVREYLLNQSGTPEEVTEETVNSILNRSRTPPSDMDEDCKFQDKVSTYWEAHIALSRLFLSIGKSISRMLTYFSSLVHLLSWQRVLLRYR